jgi:methyl-accepting chemotaxis protein
MQAGDAQQILVERAKLPANFRKGVSMKLKIGTKLAFGFVTVIVLMLAVFGVGYLGMTNADKSMQAINTNKDENFYWTNWESCILRAGFDYQVYYFTKIDSWLSDAQVRIEEAEQHKLALEAVISESRRADFESVSSQIDNIMSSFNERAIQIQDGNTSSLATLEVIWETGPELDAVISDINDSIEKSKADTAETIKTAEANQRLYLIIMIGIAVAAIIIATIIAVSMSTGISGGIRMVKNALQKMAKGDLTVKVNIKSRDEVGEMACSYNEMQQQMCSLINQFKQSSYQLNAASDQLATAAKQSSESTQQVATSAQQMAKGAQEQSSNAQETAKSIEQLSSVISQLAKGAQEQSNSVKSAISSISNVAHTMSEVADNASNAAKGAKLASDSADTGTEQARQTLSGMEKIKVSTAQVAQKIEELGTRSAEIGKIVAVIDDIAAQTNLLALNAAIEAARAGDQGRGFAVVSDEVRKLAERTASATKEIAELIGSVQKGVKEATDVMVQGNSAVNQGYDLAVKAGQSLEEILKAASEVNTQIDSISNKAQQVHVSTNELVKVIDAVGSVTEENSSATRQMSANAVQVSKSVETVAGIAEENSAATEQVSASAQEMSAQVEEIVASAQTLKEMAASLENSVAMFIVANESASEDKTDDATALSAAQPEEPSKEYQTIDEPLAELQAQTEELEAFRDENDDNAPI